MSKKRYEGLALFESQSYLALLSTYRTQEVSSGYINSAEEINRPVNSWQAIMRFDLSNSSDKSICLFYKIPYIKADKKMEGIILFSKQKKSTACKKGHDDGEEIVRLEGIHSLKIFLNPANDFMAKEKKQIKKNNLYFMIYYKNIKSRRNRVLTKSWMEFPLLNIKNINRIGVTYLPNLSLENLGENKKTQNLPQGERNDSYINRTILKCSLNSDADDSCDKCRFGWYDAIGDAGRIGFCGESHCGERGWPACPRTGIVPVDGKLICVDGSDLGICQDDLHVYCDENLILSCH